MDVLYDTSPAALSGLITVLMLINHSCRISGVQFITMSRTSPQARSRTFSTRKDRKQRHDVAMTYFKQEVKSRFVLFSREESSCFLPSEINADAGKLADF